MLKLIQNEWMKLWHKKSAWIMLLLLFLLIIGVGALQKWIDTTNTEQDISWQQEQEAFRNEYKQTLEAGGLSAIEEDNLKNELQVIENRLDHNIAPIDEMSTQQFILSSNSFLDMISMFAIVIAASIVTSEFTSGTIKMLLTRPMKRWKILASKLMTVILFGLFMSVIAWIISIATSFIFFDFSDGTYLKADDGIVYEVSIWGHSLYMYLLSFTNVLMSTIFAFMLGAIFRSSSLAIGLTLFLSFAGNSIVLFLNKYEIVKYLFMTHTDLTQYESGFTYVEGITMPFSIAVLAIYMIVFVAVSFWSFVKRDVTA